MLVENLLWSTLLMVITVFMHMVVLVLLWRVIDRFPARAKAQALFRALALGISVVLIFFAHVLEMSVYAGFYLWQGEFVTLEAALYFSASTFTTVGYGDVFLDEKWRLLSALQSANGFLLIGWSTAYLFALTQALHRIERTITR